MNRFSPYRFSESYQDAEGRTFLSPRRPFRFRDYADNRRHIVVDGDRLWFIARKFFASIETPSRLWWVIADFQPDPIHDPTIALDAGRLLFVPSTTVLLTEILSEVRKKEPVE